MNHRNRSNQWSQVDPNVPEHSLDPMKDPKVKHRTLPGIQTATMLHEARPRAWGRWLTIAGLAFFGVGTVGSYWLRRTPALQQYLQGSWEQAEESKVRGVPVSIRSQSFGARYLFVDGEPVHRIQCKMTRGPEPCLEHLSNPFYPQNRPHMMGMALALPMTEYLRGSSPHPAARNLRNLIPQVRRRLYERLVESDGGDGQQVVRTSASLAQLLDEAIEAEDEAGPASSDSLKESPASSIPAREAAEGLPRRLNTLHIGATNLSLVRMLRERFRSDITIVEPDLQLLGLVENLMDLQSGPHPGHPEESADPPGETRVFAMDPLQWLLGRQCFKDVLGTTRAQQDKLVQRQQGSVSETDLLFETLEREERAQLDASVEAANRLVDLMNQFEIVPNDLDFGLAAKRTAQEEALARGKPVRAAEPSESVSLVSRALGMVPAAVRKWLPFADNFEEGALAPGEDAEEDGTVIIPAVRYPTHQYDLVFVDLHHKQFGQLPNLRHRLVPLHLRQLLRPGGVAVVNLDLNTPLPPLARFYSREFQHVYTAEQTDGNLLMYCFYDDPNWKHPEVARMLERAAHQGGSAPPELSKAEAEQERKEIREACLAAGLQDQARINPHSLADFARMFSRREELPLDCANSLYTMSGRQGSWTYLPLVMNMSQAQKFASGSDKFHFAGVHMIRQPDQ